MKKEINSNRQLALSSLNHFTIDWYTGFLNPLLPVIMTTFSLSEGNTAFISASLGILAAFVQPVGAALGVRFSERKMQLFSLLLAATCMPLIGIAPHLWILVIFLVLGNVGNAVFHPNAAAFVGKMGFRRQHSAMSVFSIGGTLGGALSPIMIVWYVKIFGMNMMFPLMAFGLVIALLSLVYLPKVKSDSVQQMTGFGFRDSLRVHGVKRLVTVTVLRSLSLGVFTSLIALYLQSLGYGVVWGGYFLTAGTLAGVLGNYTGAFLSDKIGPKSVNAIGLFAATPFALLIPVSKNIYLMLALYVVMCFFAFSNMAVNIAYMQRFLPHRKGIASSLTMGISWGISSVVLSALMLIVNFVGINPILFVSGVAFLAGGVTVLGLPADRIEVAVG